MSLTSTDWAAVAALPAASAAVHVTTVVPIGNTGGASLSSEATPTASVASAVPMSTAAPAGESASAVTLAGARSDGGVVSATVTSCPAVIVLPAASAAVHVTTVVPSPNRGGASLATETTPTASEAVARPWSTAVPSGPAASASTESGAYTAGGVVSTTETTCESDASFPASSAAVQVTTVLPTLNASGASLASEATPTASVASAAPMSTEFASGEAASAVTSGGADTDGGTVSRTVTVCCACAAFPAASAAVHVTTVSPIGYDGGASLPSSTTPTASEAAAVPMPPTSVRSPDASALTAGGAASDGGTVSRTVTDCPAVAALPAASAAVHVTTVVPIGNTAGASLSSEATPTASVASAAPMSTAAPAGESASAAASGGADTDGGTASRTVTDCLAVAALPAASAAVHVTTVVPIGNTAGASLSSEATPTASDASAEPKPAAGAPPADSASSVASGGADTDGGTVSRTVTSCTAVAALPASSVTVHVTTVVPSLNTAGASFVTEAIGVTTAPPPPLPPTTICPRGTAAPPADSASAVTAGGTSTDGGVVSTTRTSCAAAALLPDASVAFHVTLCVPSANASGASLVTETACASETLGRPSRTAFESADSASNVTSGGASIAGGVVSTTRTSCAADASFPAASIAVHVTVAWPILNNGGASFVTDATPEPPSDASASPSGTAFESADSASNVTSGGARIDGSTVSDTTTVCTAVASLPTTSRAVHVTAVAPRANRSGASLAIDMMPTASVTGGSASSTAVPPGPAASAVTPGSPPITGGTVSRTITFCVATAMLPAPSMAVQMTVLVPSVNCSGALLSSDRMPLASEATACPMLTGVRAPVASTVRSAGAVTVGFVRSAAASAEAAGAASAAAGAWAWAGAAAAAEAEAGGGRAAACPGAAGAVSAGSENAWMRWLFESATYSRPAGPDTARSAGSLNWPARMPSLPQAAVGVPDSSSRMTRLLNVSATYRPPNGAAARPCACTSMPPTLAS